MVDTTEQDTAMPQMPQMPTEGGANTAEDLPMASHHLGGRGEQDEKWGLTRKTSHVFLAAQQKYFTGRFSLSICYIGDSGLTSPAWSRSTC